MRRSLLLILLTSLTVLPLIGDERHQSYITYESGGSTIRSVQDDRTMEGRVNLPVFPGDEVATSRRGRLEIRLADGNVIALNRDSVIRFDSIRNSYDGERDNTVAYLTSGHAVIHRISEDDEPLRLDSEIASYVSLGDAVYSVETSGRGRDTVSVFDGAVEVRTEGGVSRLRTGERAKVDFEGVGSIIQVSRHSLDDFEEWALDRAAKYGRRDSRYLDPDLSYADEDLDAHGSWVYISDYGRAWRPRVSIGWRPYYHGSWVRSPHGDLVWVSEEPWGWVPYHYGRWAYTSRYGWVWVPGGGYSHAWVYWAFGPTYVGWVPAGWYDCYGPYYSWLYRPYYRTGIDVGFGFYGRIRLGDVDLHPWTFVRPGVLVSQRIDAAAMTIDAVRDRLARDGDTAAVGRGAVRFTRDDLRDPDSAVRGIARRGLGGGTGREGSGVTTDMTPFFRRDPELSNSVRDRISRLAGGSRGTGSPATSAPGRGVSSGSGSPSAGRVITRPSLPGNSGEVTVGRPGDSTWRRPATGQRETPAPSDTSSGRVSRGGIGGRDTAGDDSDSTRGRSATSWRTGRGSSAGTPADDAPASDDSSAGPVRRGTSGEGDAGGAVWRRGRDSGSGDGETPAPTRSRDRGRDDEGAVQSPVPRRVIDSIGGPRVTPSTGSGEQPRNERRPSSSSGGERPIVIRPERRDPPPAAQQPPPQRQAPKSDDGGSRRRAKSDAGKDD